jgi:hypothetical protein
MGYLIEGLELSIRRVAYTKYDATTSVRWSNYSQPFSQLVGVIVIHQDTSNARKTRASAVVH